MCKINGKKLGELRSNAGVSREELAKEIGLSKSSVYNYESGKSEPTEETMDKICLVLNISKDDIKVHDVGYSFLDQMSKTVNQLRNKKGFVRYSTPSETEEFVSERRVMSEEEEKREIEVGLRNTFGIGQKKYMLVSPTLIHIPNWQRDTDMAKAEEISTNFNEDKFDPIKVYLINGKLYVADGAHRLIAFIINEELKILVEVLNCTENEAVLTFLGQQSGRKTMSVNDTYRAGVKANIKEYVKFKYLFEDYNIQITADEKKISNPIGYIRASSSVLRLANRNEEIVRAIIELVIKLDWCGSDKNVFVSRTFSVIKKLYSVYGKENVEEKLLDRCKGATYFDSKVAPVKSNTELYDILSAEINK